MSSNIVNEDLRNIKTEKALHAAMFSLLEKLNFRKITVKGICEQALISRATFYAHFLDKYDLLNHWVIELWPKDFDSNDSYEQMERLLNRHIHENMTVLKNLVEDADDETLDILFNFMRSHMNLHAEKGNNGEMDPKNIVLSHFYAGGMISYLLWQVKHKFPPDVPPINRHIYELILELQAWHTK